MARMWQAGTGAEQVVVWLRVGERAPCPRPRRAAGPRRWRRCPSTARTLPPLPDADLSVPVVHQGDLLGAISVTMPKD